jgi:hypothetical protein
MSTYSDLVTDINNDITNYAPKAFKNRRLWNILLRMVAWIQSGGTTGPITAPSIYAVTSVNFTTNTQCPITALDGQNIQVFWNEVQRYLEQDAGEWTDLAGGGFEVLIAGFNKNDAVYHFKVSIAL